MVKFRMKISRSDRMKKLKWLGAALVVVLFLMIVMRLWSAPSIYGPMAIPFPYDPNAVEYKLLAGVDVRVGREAVVDVNCYDPDGDPFSVRVLNWQAGMNCTNGTTWRLRWTPIDGQEGLHYVNIEAWDFPPDPNDALTDRGTLVFNVRPRNRPPVLLPCGG